MARIAMIGATGLIGRYLAPSLVAAGHDLLIIGRRESAVAGARDKVAIVEHWDDAVASEAVDVAISTLGTTRKVAGSMDAFEVIDRTAVVDFARAAHEAGARQWMMVSSTGADPHSRNAYLAVKGRAEADVLTLGFDRVDIFRPGLLVGPREEKRPAERLGMLISPLMNLILGGPLDRYQAIPAKRVAEAMAKVAGTSESACEIYHNREIRALT